MTRTLIYSTLDYFWPLFHGDTHPKNGAGEQADSQNGIGSPELTIQIVVHVRINRRAKKRQRKKEEELLIVVVAEKKKKKIPKLA